MGEHTVELTDANFAEVTAKGVALVDFWAARCPPCRMQGPIVDKLAGTFAERATVGKLDVDSNPVTPSAYKIMYIPTLIIFKDGREQARFTGLQAEAKLATTIKQALAGR